MRFFRVVCVPALSHQAYHVLETERADLLDGAIQRLAEIGGGGPAVGEAGGGVGGGHECHLIRWFILGSLNPAPQSTFNPRHALDRDSHRVPLDAPSPGRVVAAQLEHGVEVYDVEEAGYEELATSDPALECFVQFFIRPNVVFPPAWKH